MARYKQIQRDLTYRIYISDSLQNIPQNKFLTTRYYDLIYNTPQKTDNRTGDEIAADVINRLGLKVGE